MHLKAKKEGLRLMKQNMEKYNVFDMNAHLTIKGDFKDYKENIPAWIDNYLKSSHFNFEGINIVGLPKIGGYNTNEYIKFTEKISLNIEKYTTIAWEEKIVIAENNKNKFRCIKVHPRLLDMKLNEISWDGISEVCKKSNSILGICTYVEDSDDERRNAGMYKKIIDKLLKDGNRIIFFHSFSDLFKEFWEEYKNNDVIFDTSFTLKRNFRKIYSDYRTAISEENGKICFGSDFPDYHLDDYKNNLDELLFDLKYTAKQKYLSQNAINFLRG